MDGSRGHRPTAAEQQAFICKIFVIRLDAKWLNSANKAGFVSGGFFCGKNRIPQKAYIRPILRPISGGVS